MAGQESWQLSRWHVPGSLGLCAVRHWLLQSFRRLLVIIITARCAPVSATLTASSLGQRASPGGNRNPGSVNQPARARLFSPPTRDKILDRS
jgi:hypothetical protein